MTLSIISIILVIVAVIVTVIGFFASLKFYRDGMNLQSGANTALAKIAEKSDSIYSQVGGMFDKTLDALIGRYDLKSNFEALNEQLESAADAIVNCAVQEIGTAGEEEKQRLSSIVRSHMNLIKAQVQQTRESAEQFTELQIPNHLKSTLQGKGLDAIYNSEYPVTTKVLAAIFSSDHPVTTEDIASTIGIDKSIIRPVLATLSQQGMINTQHDAETNTHLFSPNPTSSTVSKT